MRFTDIRLTPYGFRGQNEGNAFSANWPLFLIGEAWHKGADYEALADGFGSGEGTHGDWSSIRDSGPGAMTAMLQVALNHLFGGQCTCGWPIPRRRCVAPITLSAVRPTSRTETEEGGQA